MSEKQERLKRRLDAFIDKELLMLDQLIRQQEEIDQLKAQIKLLETQLKNLEATTL